jgi:glycosyltransferase involved in cell wall biosynthesis
LCPIPKISGPLTEEVCRLVQAQQRRAIEEALQRWPIDLVHLHGIDFHRYLPGPGVPALVTLHLPPAWYPPEVFQLERPRTYLHCVSNAQRRACPPEAQLLPVIENGVPTDVPPPVSGRRRFAMTLGRICPEKGFHLALDAAWRARTPCLVAGQVFRYAAHEQYFEQEIMPRLDASRRFIGPVGCQRKRRLLAAARCLLAPSLAPETSSLVAMEALAAGTPVIAFPAGALADIVEHERTGFLVHDQREMADAIQAADLLDPEACREAARRRFSLARMTASYLDFYARLAGSSTE